MAKRSDEKLLSVTEVSECPAVVQSELRDLVEEGSRLHSAIVRLDEIKKRIAEIVIEEHGIINDAGVYGVRSGPHCIIVRQQDGRETIKAELLIENGVTPKQIADSKSRGKGFVVVEFNEMTGD